MAKKSARLLPGFDAEGGSPDPEGNAPAVPPVSPVPPAAPRKAARKKGAESAGAAPAVPLVPEGPPPTHPEGKRVWVLDAPSLIYQVFHALPPMTGPKNEPVNAVFGLANDVLRIRREHRPDFLFAAYDTSEPTFRDGLYDEYKAHRAEMPEDLSAQWGLIREAFEVLGVPILELDGFEADDVLATLARTTVALGGECVLVSGDKDIRQLLSPAVRIFHLRKNLFFVEADLQADWGIRAEQVVDWQGLVGDPVDHIPGVPQIGPKTATQLLAQFGTLEGVLAGAHTLPPSKKRDNLIQYADQALLSRTLATLEPNVPIEIPWSTATGRDLDPVRALEFFERFDFRRLSAEMRAHLPPEPPLPWIHEYRAVTDVETLREVCAELTRHPWFSLDTETTGLHPRDSDLVGISLAVGPGKAWYLPLKAPAGEPVLPWEAVVAELGPILADPRYGKSGQNLKFDVVMLRNAGLEVHGLRFDTMLASYLLDAGRRNHGLDELSRTHLRHDTIKISQLIGSGKNQKRMDEVPLGQIIDYAAEDADVAWRLVEPLAGRLHASSLTELFDTLEMPLVDVLVDLEYVGVFVDGTRLAELSTLYGTRLAGLEQEIYALAGHEFNIQSPKQMQTVLFEELKLPVRRKVSTGASTDADVLEELAPLHPLPAKVIEYREFAKLKGTYVDAFPSLISQRTGRIHAGFNQHVAATGRLSSSNPNLQNIPIRTPEGRSIRAAFRPQEAGWKYVCADYSQIELRVLAHCTEDPNLIAAFREDHDIHALVAAQIYGTLLEDVDKDMRRRAKTVNFGVIYGQSPWGLARELGIPNAEAEKFIDDYFRRYPTVEVFISEVFRKAREDGYVQTLLGRRRAVEGIRADPGRQKNFAERTAANTVIQGTAADIIKRAMVRLRLALREHNLQARMVLQIHDELVFEAPDAEVPALVELVRREMSTVVPLRVPLKVDVSVGPNWLETETV